MRVLWCPVLAVVAGLVAPARAEPAAAPPEASTSLEPWAAAIGSPATRAAPAPGGRPPARPGEATPAREVVEPRFALGVSSPFGWLRGSFSGSIYIGVAPHHAMRVNVGQYHAEALVPLLITGGESAPVTGSIVDLGIGWAWYPRRLWDGVTLELGALRRERDVVDHSEIRPAVTTRSVTHAGRAMIGWSWLMGRRVFLSLAAGVSVGREAGRATSAPDFEMPTSEAVARLQVDAETYVRVGFAYGR